MLDLEPATRTLVGIVEAIDDDQLDLPTPCDAPSRRCSCTSSG